MSVCAQTFDLPVVQPAVEYRPGYTTPDYVRSGYSFCIITDGKEPEKTVREIESITALDGWDRLCCEIVLGGNYLEVLLHPDLMKVNLTHRLDLVYMPELAQQGRLGAMRNRVSRAARFDHIILADDDLLFDHEFLTALRGFGEDWDVMAPRIVNPDGSRFWDWKTHQKGVNKLLPYEVSGHMDLSLTGGLMILKRFVTERVQWDEEKGFYQEEDVAFSQALKAARMRIRLNTACKAMHMADYTQSGNVVVRK